MQKLPTLTATFTGLLALALAFSSGVEAQRRPDVDASGQKSPALSALKRVASSTDPAQSQQSRDAQPSPASGRQPNDSDGTSMTAFEVFKKARRDLSSRTIKAKLIQTISIGDQKLKASGSYIQGRDLKMRMSVELRVGRQGTFQGSLLQVCDGEVLWTSHTIGRRPDDSSQPAKTQPAKKGQSQVKPEEPKTHVTRRDVRQIIDEMSRAGGRTRNAIIAELGLGGISELLTSLQDTMIFAEVEQQKIENELYLVLEGHWNEDVISRLTQLNAVGSSEAKQTEESLPRLPQHIPDIVRVYFQRFDGGGLFPRRILYLKRPPARNFFRPMVSLDFDEVRLNTPVDDSEFEFVPPDRVYTEDVTQQYLNRLRSSTAQPGSTFAPPGSAGNQ